MSRASSTNPEFAGESRSLRKGDETRGRAPDAGGPAGSPAEAGSGGTLGPDARIPGDAAFLGTCDGIDLYSAGSPATVAAIWRDFQKTAWFTPFQDIDWISAWLASRPEHARPRMSVILAYSGDRLRMILPMAKISRYGFHELHWAADNCNDLNAPLIDPDFIPLLTSTTVKKIWARLAESGEMAGAICLRRQPERIAGHPNPFITRRSTGSSCETHSLSLHTGWTDLYASLRSAKSRRRLREKLKKLRKAGRLSFRGVRAPVERQLFIDRILCWKSEQLRSAGERDPFAGGSAGSGVRATILGFARRDADARKLRVYGLYVDGKPLAGLIGFSSGDTFSMLTMAYAPDSDGSTSPGLCLLLKTLELAARSGLGAYDFLAGDEPYKFEWCDTHTRLRDDFFGMTAGGLSLTLACRLLLALKKAVKSNPFLFGCLKAANAWRIRTAARRRGPEGEETVQTAGNKQVRRPL